ncbi:sialidase family protein [Pseudomarimonas salicorniae]|uniref:Glycoside hydrolase n=1 Tax=Pseudomarimonas salicorniae TaxID=2933270 RepID=A0ABT0GHM4_9GAMM|nr:sialidase family protein [Lysobacter sp. CAU 1642]MCK7594050.1 glycoside hydrolase [Lysobacter sp. CAU 1642]
MLARLTTFLLACVLPLAGAVQAGAPAVEPLDLPGQAQGSVLATAEGFLLSWIERSGAVSTLRFAEMDREGIVRRRGEVMSGRQWFVNWADFPALIVADNGDWLGYALVKSDPAKPYAYDIYTTRSTDRGESWSAPQVLHDDGTPTEHGFVSLLPDGDDRILAVWLDGRRTRVGGGHDGHDHGGVHTALHTAVLTREGVVERRELDDLTCDCCRTSMARGQEGPVVVYRDRTREEVRDIFEVSRVGLEWSPPTPLPVDDWTMPGCPVNGPAITAQGPALIAAWPTQAEGLPVLRLALRDQGSWQTLPDLDRGQDMMGRVDLAPWTESTTLAVWLATEGGQTTLRLAEIGADGLPRWKQLIARLPAGRGTGMPRIAARDGQAIVVWTEPGVPTSRLRGALISQRARSN